MGELANKPPRPRPPLTPLPTLVSLETTPPPSRPPSPRDPLPSLSKLTREPSRCTLPVSLPALPVEPTLTTVSSPSDMELKAEKNTTLLRTLGVLAGETRDTSRSELAPVLVSAVSRKTPSVLPPTDDSVFISSI